MKKNIVALFLLLAPALCRAEQPTAAQDRAYWIEVMTTVADPLLENMSRGKLRATMPVETISGAATPSNARTTHLEALGRLVAGIAPWLELGGDKTPEGRLREKYIRLTLKSIKQGFDPASPDYLNFTQTRQPLVDAAFFCQGLLRAPKQLWGRLDRKTRERIIFEMNNIRKIEPVESNWLLFSATVEAAMLEFTGEWNPAPVDYAIMRFKEWYAGDGWYADGKDLHMDYYNSFVIHPMLVDILAVMQRHGKGEAEFAALETERFRRYAAQLERFVSPDGAYPVVGRSIAYRFGSFQALSQAALLGVLPEGVSPAQARCAITAVVKRHMAVPGNFDAAGWLTLGFAGHQPEVAERYISTGSLYLCTGAFVALGLPASDAFWRDPFTPWTGLRTWSGDPTVVQDKAIKN